MKCENTKDNKSSIIWVIWRINGREITLDDPIGFHVKNNYHPNVGKQPFLLLCLKQGKYGITPTASEL